MSILHIGNTQFEWECETQKKEPLASTFLHHPFSMQLQYLPILYSSGYPIGVTHLPNENFFASLKAFGIAEPHLRLLSEKDFSDIDLIDSWGYSRNIADWSVIHELAYPMPTWDIVREVNSKAFSFEYGEPLKGSALLNNEEAMNEWLNSTSGHKVLKTCFGVAGKGHLIIDNKTTKEQILQFVKKEWGQGRPIIGEPWVNRILDFSTQWEISVDGTIDYLGSTICENDGRGVYKGTHVGEEESLFGIHEPSLKLHQRKARPILEIIAKKGYFGNIGIDAFIYEEGLQPIVEVNARKTMGWLALEIQKKHFPSTPISLTLSSNTENPLPLLPTSLHGFPNTFKHQLYLHFDTKRII